MGLPYLKLFKDYRKHISLLSDEEKGQLLMALFDYAEEKEILPLSPAARMAFSFIAAQMDRDEEEYQNKCETSKENGKKGGRPPGKTEGKKNLEVLVKNPNNQPVFSKTQKNRTVFSETQKSQDKDKEEDKDKEIFPPIAPQGADGEEKAIESVTVQIARGAGENPVDHSTTLQESRFAEFWAAYPKKTGKGAVEKIWKRLHPDTALFAKMLETLEAFKQSDQWQRENGQFIPNPATWLNQKRWEDEVPKQKGGNSHANSQGTAQSVPQGDTGKTENPWGELGTCF